MLLIDICNLPSLVEICEAYVAVNYNLLSYWCCIAMFSIVMMTYDK